MARSLEPRRVWEQARDGRLRILDLRTEAERRRHGAPPGATPVSLAAHVLTPAGKGAAYLCQHAIRSKLTLRSGALEVAGGFVAWRDAGLPVESCGADGAGDGRQGRREMENGRDGSSQRGELVAVVEGLFASGVMQHSGHGNVSSRCGEQTMLLSGKGVLRGIGAGGFAEVSFDGEVVAGSLEPQVAEIVAMHAAVYRQRDEVGAIVHTHSPNLTAFAVSSEPLPVVYEPLLRTGATRIPVAEWAPRGSEESVQAILAALEQEPQAPAVLLGNHGLLAFAEAPAELPRVVAWLEEAAEATLKARALGGERPLPAEALEREREHERQSSG